MFNFGQKFCQTEQRSDEMINHFLATLRELAAACEFGDMEEQMLCDQLIPSVLPVRACETDCCWNRTWCELRLPRWLCRSKPDYEMSFLIILLLLHRWEPYTHSRGATGHRKRGNLLQRLHLPRSKLPVNVAPATDADLPATWLISNHALQLKLHATRGKLGHLSKICQFGQQEVRKVYILNWLCFTWMILWRSSSVG